MKAILIIFVLLASVLFSSSSIRARELAQTDAVYAKDPNRPISVPGDQCGKPNDPQYATCIAKSKPGRKCKGVYGRTCKPPPRPNPNRPAFPGPCGKPSDPQYAKCIAKSKPGPKCGKGSRYGRPCKPPQSSNRNQPSVPGAICGKPSDPQYAKCIAKSKPGPKCEKGTYIRGSCKPPQRP